MMSTNKETVIYHLPTKGLFVRKRLYYVTYEIINWLQGREKKFSWSMRSGRLKAPLNVANCYSLSLIYCKLNMIDADHGGGVRLN